MARPRYYEEKTMSKKKRKRKIIKNRNTMIKTAQVAMRKSHIYESKLNNVTTIDSFKFDSGKYKGIRLSRVPTSYLQFIINKLINPKVIELVNGQLIKRRRKSYENRGPSPVVVDNLLRE